MMAERPHVGSIAWTDLTVPDAGRVRDFYASVVGWTTSPVEMKGYQDYAMVSAAGQPTAGVCHARGVNADLPAQWLVYVVVEDLDASILACKELGGAVIAGPREVGGGRFCVIRDPAGAVCALYQQ